MSNADKRRFAWGYEADTPQCCMCRNYRRARMPEPDKIEPPWCVTGKFEVKPNGCCDRWVDKRSGERLS